jgi:hypothetical protein
MSTLDIAYTRKSFNDDGFVTENMDDSLLYAPSTVYVYEG